MTEDINPLQSESTGRWFSSYLAIITVVFVALVTAAVVAALVVRSQVNDDSQRQLEDVVEVAIDSINADLQQSISELRAIQGFFNASQFVSREEFSIFIEPFLEESGGIQALEWVPRIRASQKDQFIASVREQGFEEFDIHPASESQDYFPVTYLVPFQGNTAALGFDLSSEETRAAALLTAWESGEISASEPITLVQETGTQLAFLVYAPVYSSKDVPATLQERQDLLEGFALGVVRFGDFINNAIPDTFDPAIGITVVDAYDHPDIILFSNEGHSLLIEGSRGLHTDSTVKIADKVWEFHFTAPVGYGLGWLNRAAWLLVLGLGLLFSTVILGVTLLLYKGRQAALRLSFERLQSEEVQRALADELTQLIDTANNPIFGVDIDGRINIWNDVMQDITGASGEEAIGRFAVDFMLADFRPIAQSHLQSVLSGTASGSLSLKFSGLTEDSAELMINCTVRRDAAGEIIGVLAVGLDITERLRAEQEIRRLAQVNGALAEIGRIFNSSTNVEDVWGQFTDAAQELLRFDRIAILSVDVDAGKVHRVHISGTAVPELVTGAEYQLAGSVAEMVVQSRTPVLLQGEALAEKVRENRTFAAFNQAGLRSMIGISLISNDEAIGAIIFHSADSNSYSDRDLEAAAGIGAHIAGAFANSQLYQEITTLNESLEIRVADRTKELQETLEELEAFSYSVSHDLRGPLRSINGFSIAVMQKYGDKLDDEGRSYLERVRNSTNQMGTLIDDLLGLSQIGRAELIQEPLDLGKMVQVKEAELRNADPERQVEFVIADDTTAFGDERLIGVLVDNLVRNAWKFSSRHATARIELGKRQQNGETVFFVKDDGAGFDMEYADKLFLPFQRLHPTGEFEGTGIGLATVKRIVQRHGGRIWAEGEVEKGATIYFTLENGANKENG
ncbi:MAG: CHASE domain-containing protein [Chloroflexi bacterium]|nr:CHASE domain-containing protein [Chloroflexota bacterium]